MKCVYLMGRLSDYIIDFELNDPEIVAEEQERNKVTSWVCNKDQKKKIKFRILKMILLLLFRIKWGRTDQEEMNTWNKKGVSQNMFG